MVPLSTGSSIRTAHVWRVPWQGHNDVNGFFSIYDQLHGPSPPLPSIREIEHRGVVESGRPGPSADRQTRDDGASRSQPLRPRVQFGVNHLLTKLLHHVIPPTSRLCPASSGRSLPARSLTGHSTYDFCPSSADLLSASFTSCEDYVGCRARTLLGAHSTWCFDQVGAERRAPLKRWRERDGEGQERDARCRSYIRP
ncbi:hypothetical protein CALCODRAFT_77091 [Calocera cornea HHB12733]|uniref:Uncharacterized protein n=1 Tax=Calocera cornea HHB12733 TaxID=1353952 RepID=A0A165DHH6_9BASI|nr:hypothetical protein CALCODRAFT_77091 [Calocera cornea HHB12733]